MKTIMPFKEFKCKTRGFGYLKRCEECVAMNKAFNVYYDMPEVELKEHVGNYLFPKCKKCGMRYVHDMEHSGLEGWQKQWTDGVDKK